MFDLDGHKLIYHPQKASKWLNCKDRLEPLTVELSPTSACNHRCYYCAFDYRRSGLSYTVDDFARLDGISRDISLIYGGEGEPTANPRFFDNLDELSLNRMSALITNGSNPFLEQHRECFKWIRISLDAARSETYNRIHGLEDPSAYGKVLENIQRLTAPPRKTVVGIQALLLVDNASELEELVRLARDLGADYFVLKPYSHNPLSNHDSFNTPEPSYWLAYKQALSVWDHAYFRDEAFQDSIDLPRGYEGCPGAWAYHIVASDMTVYSCAAHVGNPAYALGNLRYQTWSEFISSEKRHWILKKIIEEPCSLRRPCRLDSVNRYLWRLIHPEAHDAFL